MKSETEGKSEDEAYRIITAANGWEESRKPCLRA